MQIRVINPYGGTEFHGRENLEKIKRPDTQFDMVDIAESLSALVSLFSPAMHRRHYCKP